MKLKTKAILASAAAASWLLPAGWLFASGNLPAVYCEKDAVMAVNRAWPRLSAATFAATRKICRDLRLEGIPVPVTYNERMIRIAHLRRQVDHVCNSILNNTGEEISP